MATQQSVVGRRTPLKRHMVEANAGRLFHQYTHEVRQGASTRGAVTGRTRVTLGFGHHFAHGLHVAGRPRDHAKLEAGNLRNRGEVCHRVIVKFFINMREQHHRAAGQHDHGLAIGFGNFHRIQRNAASGSGFVFHHNGAKVVAQRVGHHAGQYISRAPRRKTHHDLERRFVLCLQAG